MLKPNTQLGIGTLTGPTSLLADWLTILTGPTVATTIADTGFDGSAVANSSAIFKREQGTGTNIRVRLGRTKGATASTALKYVLLGAYCTDESQLSTISWEILPNVTGDAEVTVTLEAGDLFSNGNDAAQFSTALWDDNTHDCGGCNYFAFVTTQALVLSGAAEADAIVQVKIL